MCCWIGGTYGSICSWTCFFFRSLLPLKTLWCLSRIDLSECIHYIFQRHLKWWSDLEWWWSLYDIEFCINFIFSSSGSEWTSGLKHYIHDQKNPSSNPTMCSAGLWDPTALQGSWWPLGQNQYPNEVINKGQEAVPSKVAQN